MPEVPGLAPHLVRQRLSHRSADEVSDLVKPVLFDPCHVVAHGHRGHRGQLDCLPVDLHDDLGGCPEGIVADHPEAPTKHGPDILEHRFDRDPRPPRSAVVVEETTVS